ncbi:two-component system, OmpR family, response regulator/two-component system, OmpR family, response regulator QseB [Kushneria avicenniae]|uniref:Two-component system, OmpR family, response regulator/two-component system, OmpR family, response regulator QseB n=1 Tax=Kushneria avicenniae TaxID=402385 RepID=A0A1I1JIP4_9GAMM|nr:response regulator [Kushneria avicenniae]SFC48407.1 two-component system, OmpR family, response regulator/two-component system, OmpR family, response regulator QseB [Kushneria avicenniae]
MRILIVEDDMILGEGLCEGLRLSGYTVDWLTYGEEALHALEADAFDAVILDLALPGCSGLEVLTHWRRSGHYTPVLILTAREGNDECIRALDLGADEHVVKPVDTEVLEARLRVLHRRANGHPDNRLSCGDISLDRGDRMVWLGDRELALSAYEFLVLEALMERPGRSLSREQLEARLYGWEGGPESNSLQVLIHKLRSKLGAERIVTVRGMGYRLHA